MNGAASCLVRLYGNMHLGALLRTAVAEDCSSAGPRGRRQRIVCVKDRKRCPAALAKLPSCAPFKQSGTARVTRLCSIYCCGGFFIFPEGKKRQVTERAKRRTAHGKETGTGTSTRATSTPKWSPGIIGVPSFIVWQHGGRGQYATTVSIGRAGRFR